MSLLLLKCAAIHYRSNCREKRYCEIRIISVRIALNVLCIELSSLSLLSSSSSSLVASKIIALINNFIGCIAVVNLLRLPTVSNIQCEMYTKRIGVNRMWCDFRSRFSRLKLRFTRFERIQWLDCLYHLPHPYSLRHLHSISFFYLMPAIDLFKHDWTVCLNGACIPWFWSNLPQYLCFFLVRARVRQSPFR